MNPIISVRNLSKKYIIGENIHGRGARTFRDIFDYKTKRLFRRGVNRRKEDTTIWALKDVSFDVDQGEVVGIIGRNGAGKSTLLKILSRITEPTEGNVILRGRVTSLLEVGTGFNGELTGRENIFLNGSILGMKRNEIKNRFDEIVAFAEVEKFVDTPVKHYSSGMYVRLAFAVAAHLEPEILLVDEVLAVGDVAFQKKCLGKIGSFAKEGRTVLFVSHNMGAILRLCRRCVILDCGNILADGATDAIIAKYILVESKMPRNERCWPDRDNAPGDETVRLRAIRIYNQSGTITEPVDMRKELIVEIEYEVLERLSMSVGFQVVTSDGTVLFRSTDWDIDGESNLIRGVGIYRGRCCIPGELLNEGSYTISWIMDDPGRKMIKEHELIAFELRAVTNIGGKLDRPGVIRLRLPWQTEKLSF